VKVELLETELGMCKPATSVYGVAEHDIDYLMDQSSQGRAIFFCRKCGVVMKVDDLDIRS